MVDSKLKFEAILDPSSRSWGLVDSQENVHLPLIGERVHVEVAERLGTSLKQFLADGGLRYTSSLGCHTTTLNIEITETGIPLAITLIKEIGGFFQYIFVDLLTSKKNVFNTEGDDVTVYRWLKAKQKQINDGTPLKNEYRYDN